MSQWHSTPSGNDAAADHHREIHRQANAALPLRGTRQYSVQRRTSGTSLRLKSVPPGKSGWRFANPPEFDPANGYAPNLVVVVSTGNAAIEDGAVAGMWICVLGTTPDTPAQYPGNGTPDPLTNVGGDGQWVEGLYWVPLGGGGSGPCPLA
jgi:hypothetical protein